MTTIGVIWFMLQIAAYLAVAVGIITDRWLHWMDEPRWWLVNIAVVLLWLGRWLAAGHYVVAGIFVLVLAGDAWYLRHTIRHRRPKEAALCSLDRWEPRI